MVFFICGFLLGSTITRVSSSPTKEMKSNTKVEGAQIKSSTDVSVLTPTLTPTPIAKISTPTPKPARTPIPSPTGGPTPTPTAIPIIVLPADLEELFSKYSTAYGVDKELLKRIAKCESGLNPNAQTKEYAGLFQFGATIWIQTRTLMGQNPDLNLRLNPEEAIRTAAFMVSQNHLGIWPNCSK